jgi:hypothetical protein
MPYFNIPYNVQRHYEEKQREANLGKEMANRIIDKVKQSILNKEQK